jgi:hypothetical protein
MATVDMKASVIKGITESLNQFDIEFGPVTDYNGNANECEFAGCERNAMYTINSPVYDGRYNTVYGYACEIHVGAQTLVYAAKYVDRELDNHNCAVCESSAYACECDYLEAIGMKEAKEKVNEQGEKISYNTCRICLCDMSEHNWEAHYAEMKASQNDY